ncbi:hypothetical protein BN946_scf184911.g119 [Trametes cinnabarina]|uniref:Glutamine amidotransferase domain-containing protein n=1 Tax=Pycnoporus cinnabarinus TaxID=5643 RepID=A0A060SGV2_PYCCI|nr:hypothetical protein BN946_scf184911.g119 [Trametes cinnabarina]
MVLYLLDYGAGNVQSLANTLKKLGHEFEWISSPADFHKATSLIFPGVGAFGSAIDGLISRGLYEPLREYIASGKPYFGICIGMQVLFRSSLESSSSKGLGIIPSDIGLFSNADKSVPHMGWNSVEFLDPEEKAHEGLRPDASYYFVHSFRAAYEWDRPEVAQWAHSTTQYGREIFLATVRKGNVFACQFHPEKSGQAGLRVLDAWLRESESERASSPPSPRVARLPKPNDGFTKRVIACMDVRSNDDGDLVVTKGDQYDVRERTTANGVQAEAAGAVRNLGKPVALAARIDRDGTGLGYDLELISLVRRSVRIPVVASSGAGRKEHFVEVFEKTGVEAALAAGIFHRREVSIQEVKEALAAAKINVRTA